nr:MAG TPA: hypothetical protein [Caudoviricetes sp.]
MLCIITTNMLYSINKVLSYYLFWYVIKHIFCYILF